MSTFMGLKSGRHQRADHHHRIKFDENMRGVVIVVVGSIALVGAAWAAMIALTGPDGWATRMANSAIGQPVGSTAGEPAE